VFERVFRAEPVHRSRTSGVYAITPLQSIPGHPYVRGHTGRCGGIARAPYRRVLPGGLATLALLIFCVDDGHALAMAGAQQKRALAVLTGGRLAS
jgi:hypothetical protein